MDALDPSRLQEILAGIELLLRDIRHQLSVSNSRFTVCVTLTYTHLYVLQNDGPTSGWSKVGKTLKDIDEENIRYCKEDIDTLLTFLRPISPYEMPPMT